MREIPSAPGYFVTDEGTVYSARVSTLNRKGAAQPREMKPFAVSGGYLCVTLRCAAPPNRKVHRLVLEAFVGPRPTPEHEGRHLDGDRRNNRAGNLAWGTRFENAADKLRHGTQPRGERVRTSKLTPAIIDEARKRVEAGESKSAVARALGVRRHTLRYALNGKTWKHLGGVR